MTARATAATEAAATDGSAEPQSHPYSPAYTAAGFAFVSGALSVDTAGAPVDGRGEALDAAAERLSERLATVGGRLGDAVKLTYFVTDVSLRTEANRQFERIFGHPRPARTFVEVSRLPYGATVEIDCIAAIDS